MAQAPGIGEMEEIVDVTVSAFRLVPVFPFMAQAPGIGGCATWSKFLVPVMSMMSS